MPGKNTTTVERRSDRELVATRTFNGPARLVFEAWTRPDLFQRWWVPKSFGLTLVSCALDVRPGGKYCLVFRHPAAEQPMEFFGRYLEVTPPSRLVWTNEEGGEAGAVTTVTFEEQGGKTLLVMHDLYPSKEALDAAIASGSTSGTGETFAQLDEVLATVGQFFHVVLRTLDVAAARAFYAEALQVDGAGLDVVPLHETAIAKGARPHWLSFLDVGDVERAAAAFAQRGATAMGPRWLNPQGLEAAVMRDPGGALLALAKPPAVPRPGGSGLEVGWFVLNTPDVETAKRNYGEQFGWHFEAPAELAGFVVHPFAWRPGGPAVGALLGIENRPQVHPHWLLQFRVAALKPAVDAVRAAGGLVAAELQLQTGERIAVCDDPQGAAFALRALPR